MMVLILNDLLPAVPSVQLTITVRVFTLVTELSTDKARENVTPPDVTFVVVVVQPLPLADVPALV